MLRFAIIASVGILSAAGAARAVAELDAARRPAPTAYAASLRGDDAAPTVAAGQAAQVVKAADGHFWAEGAVNGRRVRFLVDTGATAVALTQADARRLGFQPRDLDYGYSVMTANGPARAAPVELNSVAVAGAKVEQVKAFVIEKGLDTSLLGMTYLGRLSRFEASQDALILRP